MQPERDIRILLIKGAELNKYVKAAVKGPAGEFVASDWCVHASSYRGCHRRKGPNFGRVFLMLNYTDITQNTYIQS